MVSPEKTTKANIRTPAATINEPVATGLQGRVASQHEVQRRSQQYCAKRVDPEVDHRDPLLSLCWIEGIVAPENGTGHPSEQIDMRVSRTRVRNANDGYTDV